MTEANIKKYRKRLLSITDAHVLKVAEIYHPGNDQCTILKNYGNGKYKVDVDSSSSVEYSLVIELDFSRFGTHSWASGIHDSDYRHGINELMFFNLYEFFVINGYIDKIK